MPTKREILIYSFDELSPRAQQNAIDTFRYEGGAWDEHDSEFLTGVFAERLAARGLPSDDVRWNLNYAQGDGVAFYGGVDLDTYLRARKRLTKYKKLAPILDDIAVVIEKNRDFHTYDHYNTMIVDVQTYGELTAAQERLVEELEAEIADDVKDVSRELEKIGYDEIEYRTSDEVVADNIRANEYEFNATGERIWDDVPWYSEREGKVFYRD